MSKSDFLKVQGFIYEIYPLKEFPSKNGGKPFIKREFVLETRNEGKDGLVYKNLNKFETVGSHTAILDNLGKNSEVVISFKLDGRKWDSPEGTEVIINALKCWDIKVIENTNQDIKHVEEKVEQSVEDADDDGLPF